MQACRFFLGGGAINKYIYLSVQLDNMYTCHVCVYAYIYIAQGNWNIYILVELSRLHEGTYPPSPSHIKVRHRQNQINFVNIISPFNTCIWTNLNLLSFTQGCFVPSLGEIGSVVKKVKSLQKDKQTMDTRLWAQVSQKPDLYTMPLNLEYILYMYILYPVPLSLEYILLWNLHRQQHFPSWSNGA